MILPRASTYLNPALAWNAGRCYLCRDRRSVVSVSVGLLSTPVRLAHGRPHIGANGVSWPPWKNEWKIKKRKHAKKSSFLNGGGSEVRRVMTENFLRLRRQGGVDPPNQKKTDDHKRQNWWDAVWKRADRLARARRVVYSGTSYALQVQNWCHCAWLPTTYCAVRH